MSKLDYTEITVEQAILHLSQQMKRGVGRTVKLSKQRNGSVLIRTSADHGKDVRDFWHEKMRLPR